MLFKRLSSFVVLLAVLSSCVAEEKARKEKAEAFLDATTAGPDFKIQGEYSGEITVKEGGKKSKLGVQVAARGEGNFVALFFTGGLPGEGDATGKDFFELKGMTQDGKVSFSLVGNAYTAHCDGEIFKGESTKGENFECKKIVRGSPTMGAKAPTGGVVLFDGTNTDAWKGAKKDARDLLATGATTAKEFSDFTLHLEFSTPFKPAGSAQDRGNSGVYILNRYEIQIMDSFGTPPVFNGCGALYRVVAPPLNMCYPPLAWQTYDIDFQAPRFEADKKTQNAFVTVRQNGVLLYDKLEIKSGTGAKQKEKEVPAGPIYLQDHGNPVFYRNIWIVEKK